MNVARNVYAAPGIVPGGGALELSVSAALMAKSNAVEPKLRNVYRSVAQSLEIIPRTLAQNCGAQTVKLVRVRGCRHLVEAAALPPSLTQGANDPGENRVHHR